MANVIDYLPFATVAGANVDTQANFAGSAYQTTGFQRGIAQSFQNNKVQRQASMVAAAVANVISNAMNISVLDDGNLPALVANLTGAIQTTAKSATQGMYVSLSQAATQTMAGPLTTTSMQVSSGNAQWTTLFLTNSSAANLGLEFSRLGRILQ